MGTIASPAGPRRPTRSYSSRLPCTRAGGACYLAQHCQAVAAGWAAKQPTGHLGPVRPLPSAVEIIAGVLLDQSGTHAPDHGNLPSAHAQTRAAPFGVDATLSSAPPRTKGRTGTQARG